MIQLIDQPYDIAFTRNPIIYRFRAVDDNGMVYSPIGVRSEVRVSTFHGPEDGETLTLNWTESDGTTGSVTFTATSGSPDAEDEIPAGIGSYPDWTSYYNAVGAKMKQHPIVGPLFKFYTLNRSGAGQSFWAEALELDDNWTVSWDTSGISTPPSFDVVDTETVTASTEPENYRILWDLMLESEYLSGVYEKAASGEAFLNAESEAYLNLEKIMDAKARTTLANPPIPAYDNSDPLLADNLRRYYIRYREDYDDIVDPAWTPATGKQVMIGGIAQNLFAAGDFLSGLTSDTSFLSWKPDNRTLGIGQKEYLAWYNYTGLEKNLVLEIVGTQPDGTTSSPSFAFESPNVSALPGQTILFPVGISQNPTGRVSYTVRVIDKSAGAYDGGSAVYLSPPRTYQIDGYYRETERQIMYLNGFGCPETLRCTGYFDNDFSIDREDAEGILSPGYSATTRQKFQHNEEWRNAFTYRTGYMPRLEIDSLQELLIGNQAYEIYEAAYIPLYITTKSVPITQTRQLLHSITFAAEPALRQGNYSNVLIDASTVGDLWLVSDSGYWLTIFGQRWELI